MYAAGLERRYFTLLIYYLFFQVAKKKSNMADSRRGFHELNIFTKFVSICRPYSRYTNKLIPNE